MLHRYAWHTSNDVHAGSRYPPVGIGQLRVGRSDLSLAGQLTVPKGTLFWVPHHSMQNVSFNWPHHDKFLPGESWPCLQSSKLLVPRMPHCCSNCSAAPS